MIAVIFEATTDTAHTAEYLDLAAQLLPELKKIDGFLSIERFSSLSSPNKLLSLSIWRDEQAIQQWRNHEQHQAAQRVGKASIFKNYTITVATIMRQYAQ